MFMPAPCGGPTIVRISSFTWIFFSCNSSNSFEKIARASNPAIQYACTYFQASEMVFQQHLCIGNALRRAHEDKRYLTLIQSNTKSMSILTNSNATTYRIIAIVARWCLFTVAFDFHTDHSAFIHDFLNDVTFLPNHFALNLPGDLC